MKYLLLMLLFLTIFLTGCMHDGEQDAINISSKIAAKESITDNETPTSEPALKKSSLVNGKTLEERLEEAYSDLHNPHSAQRIRDNFPDIELVYVDNPIDDPFIPKEILPFQYYYSKEANTTFNLCAVDRSVFICKGKLGRLITEDDMNSGRCIITPIYRPTLSDIY